MKKSFGKSLAPRESANVLDFASNLTSPILTAVSVLLSPLKQDCMRAKIQL